MTMSKFIYSKNTGIGCLKMFTGKYKKFEDDVLEYIQIKREIIEDFHILQKNVKKHLELWEHRFSVLKRRKVQDERIINILSSYLTGNRKRERVVGGEFIPRDEIHYIILPSKNLKRKRLVEIMADGIEELLFDEKYWTGKNKELKYWLEYIVRWFENDALRNSRFEGLVPDEEMNKFQIDVEQEINRRRNYFFPEQN